MTAPQHVHLVGIGGIHMSGIAGMLLDSGLTVSGSDLESGPLIEALRLRGAQIWADHNAAHVEGADLVVRTLAVRDDNPEIIAARQIGISILTRAEMVARLASGHTTIAIGGSHGKTTTSAMTTLILRAAGQDPSFLLGGEIPDLDRHAAHGSGAFMVVEADEYGRAFLEYRPSVAVITNIERDHLDYYQTDEALREAFAGYARTITLGGTLIVGAESPCAMRVAEQTAESRPDLHMQTFGLTPGATWQATDVEENGEATQFTVAHAGTPLGAVQQPLPGAYNVRNALAAIAASTAAGAEFGAAQRALASFRGVRRRFQVTGTHNDIVVLDDYAHHPTEIEATLEAARQRYPTRRIMLLFQPHTYSRSAYLLEGFQRCFHGADRLYITNTYAAREDASAGLSAVDLAARISEPGAIYAGSLTEAVETVFAALRPGDLVITMGAGDIEAASQRLLERLRDA